MDAKKKMVEILGEFILWPSKMKNVWMPQAIEKLADHLIANGITVQEWISVKDRLPEENTTVIVATDDGIVFQCLYSYDGWDLWDDNDVNITHWQPMPQPPKVV